MFKRINRYFLLNKRERNGVLILAALCIGVYFIQKKFIEVPGVNRVFAYEMKIENDSILISENQKKFVHKKNYQRVSKHFFYFDPNLASKSDLQQLGISEPIIKRIENYRNKGGKFYKPDDFGKIYGLKKELFDQLLPYILIQETKYVQVQKANPFVLAKESEIKRVNINRTDTGFLRSMGIEQSLALKIVKFKNYLGGFYSINQLKETNGMSDSCFNRIANRLMCDSLSLRKIKINNCTAGDLNKHPYLNFRQASAIIEYRNRHGDFPGVNSVFDTGVFSPDEWNKIRPYLSL